MFWTEVKRVRKDEQARDEMVKDVNGQILRDGVGERRGWAEYLEQVLNMEHIRKANMNIKVAIDGCQWWENWMKWQYRERQ